MRNSSRKPALSPLAPEFLPTATPRRNNAYEYHTDPYQQQLDAISFTPSQGICTPSPSPASYVAWLHPTVPLSPVAIFHDWGTHSAVTGLPSTPVFFHSSNQLRTNVQASYQRPPFGNLTNIPESRPAKLTGERKGWKIKKNRLAADEAQQEENTFELTAHNPKASGAKIPNLELTESLKDQIRSVAISWCHSRGVVIEEEAPLPVVEYAKLLSACGYELPNTLQDGTAAQQLGANARQRRTIRRSRERAIKAIEQLKLQCSTVSNTPLKENIV